MRKRKKEVWQSEHPLSIRWSHIKSRCRTPSHPRYSRYGGRGITICPEWLNFWKFVEDVGLPPSSEYELDRIDNDGNYEPGNVRWVTRSKNSANRPWRIGRAGFRGVHPHLKRFRATICKDQKKISIGVFGTAEEAGWMYDQYALAIFGEDAYTNFEYV